MTKTVEITLKDQTIQQMLSLTEADVVSQLNPQVLATAAKRDAHNLDRFTDVTRLSSMQQDLAAHLVGFLQGNALEIFLGVWAKVTALLAAAKQSSLHPADSFPVALAEHEFTWSIEPVVEILLDGAPLGKIPFTVSLNCEVESVELILQAGKIQRIASGTCDFTATIACAEQDIIHRPLTTVQLPGDFRLSHGLQLVAPPIQL